MQDKDRTREYSANYKIVVFLVLLTIFVLFGLPKKHVERLGDDEREKIKQWENTEYSDIESIIIHPLEGKGIVSKTIDKTVTVTNRDELLLLSEAMHTDHIRQHYLTGYEHWSINRRAKLEVQLNNNRIIFGVDWLAKRPVCSFWLMRNEVTTKYKSDDVFFVRANSNLAKYLNAILATNNVSWRQYKY